MFEEITGNLMMLLHSIYETAAARVYLGITIITVMGLIAYQSISGFLFAKPPTIQVTSPQLNAEVSGKQIQIQGKVVPAESRVLINGHDVYSNGDGTFTQIVDVTEGKNILKVTAEYYRKSSSVVQMVTRILTQDEIAAKQQMKEKQEAEIKKEAEKIALAAKENEAVLSAATTPEPTPSPPPTETEFNQENIKTQEVKSTPDGKIITGKYMNKTGRTIRWVKLVANVKNEEGSLIETKEAYVTNSTQSLAPLAEVGYTVPISTQEYSSYELTTSYEVI
jgi:hypothetical protein